MYRNTTSTYLLTSDSRYTVSF